MYKLLINTPQPKQHIISPHRVLRGGSEASQKNQGQMRGEEGLLFACETEGHVYLYKLMQGAKQLMSKEVSDNAFSEDLQVRSQVLLVANLKKSEYMVVMKHVDQRKQSIELVQLVQEGSPACDSVHLLIYFKSILIAEQFYSVLLYQQELLVLYIQEVGLVSIPQHLELEKQLLFIVNGLQYERSQEHMEMLCHQRYIQLPMCYRCLLRLEYSISGLTKNIVAQRGLLQSQSSCQTCLQAAKDPASLLCSQCDSQEDIWICMICSQVGCGRYKKADAFKHFLTTGHVVTINLETQRIWNYQTDSFCHRLLPLQKQEATLKFPDYSAKKGTQVYQEAVEHAFWQYCSLVSEELERQRAFYQREKAREQDRFEKQSGGVEKALLEVEKQLDSKALEVKKLLKKNKKLVKRMGDLKEKCRQDRELLSSYDHMMSQPRPSWTPDEIDRGNPKIQQKLKILQSLETEIQSTLSKLSA